MSRRATFNIITWASVFTVSVGIFILGLVIKSDYTYVGFMNSAFYTGGIIILLGLLWLVSRLGAFDIFIYGFKDVFFHMNPKARNKDKKYPDYPSYLEAKREQRKKKNFDFLWPFLAFGGTYILVTIILRIIYQILTSK